MTDDDRDRRRERPRVKVTDKRRTHAAHEGDPAARGAEHEPRRAEGASPPEGGPPRPGSERAAEGGSPEEGVAQGEGRARAPDEGEPPAATDLITAEARAAEYLEDLQRLKAEFDNYRKRILREQTRAVEAASEGVVSRLLEVLDEFELALVAAEREAAGDRFAHGVEMVYAKLVGILKAEGLERIDAKGKPFDPERHEALLQTGDDEGEPYVEDVLRTGYTLKGRVIRPAGVKVGRR